MADKMEVVLDDDSRLVLGEASARAQSGNQVPKDVRGTAEWLTDALWYDNLTLRKRDVGDIITICEWGRENMDDRAEKLKEIQQMFESLSIRE